MTGPEATVGGGLENTASDGDSTVGGGFGLTAVNMHESSDPDTP